MNFPSQANHSNSAYRGFVPANRDDPVAFTECSSLCWALLFCCWCLRLSSICIRVCCYLPLLVLKGMYHYWKYVYFSWRLKQIEVICFDWYVYYCLFPTSDSYGFFEAGDSACFALWHLGLQSRNPCDTFSDASTQDILNAGASKMGKGVVVSGVWLPFGVANQAQGC